MPPIVTGYWSMRQSLTEEPFGELWFTIILAAPVGLTKQSQANYIVKPTVAGLNGNG